MPDVSIRAAVGTGVYTSVLHWCQIPTCVQVFLPACRYAVLLLVVNYVAPLILPACRYSYLRAGTRSCCWSSTTWRPSRRSSSPTPSSADNSGAARRSASARRRRRKPSDPNDGSVYTISACSLLTVCCLFRTDANSQAAEAIQGEVTSQNVWSRYDRHFVSRADLGPSTFSAPPPHVGHLYLGMEMAQCAVGRYALPSLRGSRPVFMARQHGCTKIFSSRRAAFEIESRLVPDVVSLG